MVVWLLVVVGGVVWGTRSSESRLESDTVAALESAGIGFVDVDFDGRSGEVQLTDPRDAARALDLVEAIDGVRDIAVVTESRTTSTTEPGSSPTTTEAPGTSVATTAPPGSVTTSTAAPGDPAVARVVATLEAGALRLTGVVPDEGTSARIAAVADAIYAPFVTNEITVDPDAEGGPWLANVDRSIGFLPVIGSGTIDVSGESLVLSGSSPTEVQRNQFAGAVGQLLGLDPEVSGVEITNLGPPLYDADFANGRLALRGVMPSEELKQLIVGAAIDAYGAENVDDQMTVADGLDAPFWAYRVPLTFQQFRPFTLWDVRIENGVTSGSLRGGANFASASAELNDDLVGLLRIAAGIMLRDPTISIVVEGHTDSIGTPDDNQRLSERRAQSAVNFLLAAGIEPERLQAVGYGEQRPIATNDTEAGRAQNRRVGFVLTPVGR